MNELTAQIKALRTSIDANIKEANKLVRQRESVNEIDAGYDALVLTVTKLKEAKMWAGQVLGEIGHKLPQEYRDEAQS